MSDAEEAELEPFEELEGNYVTLARTLVTDELVGHFQKDDALRDLIGRVQPLSREILAELMEDDETLFVWRILRDREHIGYCFFATYDGPPFIGIHGFGELSVEIGQDCMEQLVPIFFKNLPNEDGLFYYLQHPVDPEVHETLVENGFDLWDENPTLNNDEIACYILERYTYDAYYGEGSDEFEEAEDDEY